MSGETAIGKKKTSTQGPLTIECSSANEYHVIQSYCRVATTWRCSNFTLLPALLGIIHVGLKVEPPYFMLWQCCLCGLIRFRHELRYTRAVSNTGLRLINLAAVALEKLTFAWKISQSDAGVLASDWDCVLSLSLSLTQQTDENKDVIIKKTSPGFSCKVWPPACASALVTWNVWGEVSVGERRRVRDKR